MGNSNLVTISVDIGSSGVRSCAFSETGALLCSARGNYPTLYPRPGFAEQDPQLWERALFATLRQVSAKLPDGCEIAAVAMTGQCPTYLPVDRAVRPVGNALTYQDSRAEAQADELRRLFGSELLHEKSGHTPFAFFILPKILWQKQHAPQLFGQIDRALQPVDYLEYLLTGGLATDAACACGTLAYDAGRGGWNRALLRRLGLKPDLFPERIVRSTDVVGRVGRRAAGESGLPEGTPVVRGGPDSQCCCYGVGALDEATLSNMSGTSTCLNSVTPAPNPDLGVGNYVHVVPGQWCMEVGLNTTGIAMNRASALLFPGCERAERFERVERAAAVTPPGSRGLLFFPYLSDGERDNPFVKGGFYGLSMRHGADELMRAVLEGVALAEKERASRMRRGKSPFTSMRISGGGAKTKQWNQIKADVMGIPVFALRDGDAAEIGAAALAAVGAGLFATPEQALTAYRLRFDEYDPSPAAADAYRDVYARFLETEKRFGKE